MAIKKEMQQLHDWIFMSPVRNKDLLLGQKKGALRYLMFLKQKICGTINGKGCMDR